MPAIVSSVEVSSGAGISDPDATRRCPRSSKNARKVSRISLDFMPVVSLGRDRGPADHQVAVEQAGGLAGRHAVGGLGELELELVVTGRGARDPAADRAGVVAELDAV